MATNWRVLGVSCSGISWSASLVSAFASAKIALSGRGIDECVDVPRPSTMTGSEDLSAVEMLTYCTLPASFAMIQPPSFSANSQSICAQWVCESQVVL